MLTHFLNILVEYELRESKHYSHFSWHDDFINRAIRVWTDDSSASKISSFTGQILPKTALFSFDTLVKRLFRLVFQVKKRYSWAISVVVKSSRPL